MTERSAVVEAAREAVMLAAFEPCWWKWSKGAEYLCSIDDAHLCQRCLDLGLALDAYAAACRADAQALADQLAFAVRGTRRHCAMRCSCFWCERASDALAAYNKSRAQREVVE